MTVVPKPLTIDKAGKLHSPDNAITILYSNPFPIPFCSEPGKTGQMRGAVEHTTGGFWQSAVDLFESKTNESGSAHFLVGSMPGEPHEGDVMQFTPIGTGIETYHAFSANIDHYGIEHTDNGTSGSGHAHVAPISDKGMWADALLMEFLSRFAGFPLQLQAREFGWGYGYHREFTDWNRNAHTCPGATMTDMTRVSQRDEILNRAKAIRSGVMAKPRTPGHVAYAAHGDALGWQTLAGVDIPFWTHAQRKEQLAWEAAAKAVGH